MKRIGKILLGTTIGAILLTGTALAAPKLNLFINGAGYVSDYLGLKVENGSVLVPIDKIAAEFKGNATYDAKTGDVRVTLSDAALLAHQLQRFEDAFRADEPKQALDTWIEGVTERNGSLQYAVFSPELRQKTKAEFDANFWVTGGSSPHMGKIEKLVTKQVNETTLTYSFNYHLIASNYDGLGSAVVTVQKLTTDRGDGWYVTNIKLKNPGDLGIMIGVEQLK
ncbi:hypothetical protein EDM56_09620 [Brevibacillus fluminis]|uniref:Copper amine oxidase N-terminal domain-containing protein n=1 Tax=Brevibacillus fluminis TaxID=511487 RepID=A0A3M8DPL5_9BACL|nr:hypothetical protein [Brevibacillus fluminis]RNB89449.1 hypothetical protein EDM56_09620 [Brevibacillus fluminis]